MVLLDIVKAGQKWGTKAFASIADQGIISGTNFAVNILLARWLTLEEYGVYSVAFTIFLFVSEFHNALILEPMSVLGPAHYADQHNSYIKHTLWLQTVLTGGLMLLLIIAGLVWHQYALGKSLYGLSFATPLVLLFWFLRRAHYLKINPEMAMLSSVVYALALVGFILSLLFFHALTVTSALMAMGGASAAASILSWSNLRRHKKDQPKINTPQPPGIGRPSIHPYSHGQTLRVLKENWAYGKWLVALSMLSLAASYVQTFLTAAYLGLEAAGVLRAMTNFMLPMAQTVTALSMLGLPIFAENYGRGRMAEILRARKNITGLLLTLSCGYEIVLSVFCRPLEKIIYGGKFSEYTSLIPILGLIPVFTALATGYCLVLRAAQRPQHYLIMGAVSAPVGLISALVCITLGGLEGAAISMVLTSASAAATAMILYRAWFVR